MYEGEGLAYLSKVTVVRLHNVMITLITKYLLEDQKVWG